MRITLESLDLKNFKKLTGKFIFDKVKNCFMGQNGTGKTTVYDGPEWLLWGKDSRGSAKFDIKTIIDGKPLSKVDHSVIGHYLIDGTPLKLERVFAEKWTKTRGNLEAEKDGHHTTYCIDDGPKVAKKIYDAKVLEIFGGEPYKIVTDIRYFACMKWEKRREILSGMVQAIDKDSIIDSIDGLRELLGDKTIDESKIMADQRKKKINEELKTLPARIAENKEHISKASEGAMSIEVAEKGVLDAEEAVKVAKDKIANFEKGDSSEDVKKLQDLNQKLRTASTAFENEKNQAQSEVDKRLNRINEIALSIPNWEKQIEENAVQIKNLTASWKQVNKSVFETAPNTCKSCGVVIVCHSCDESDEAGQESFNIAKSEQLESITESGKRLTKDNVKISETIKVLEKEKSELEAIEKPGILSLSSNAKISGLKSEIEKINKPKDNAKIPEEFNQELSEAETGLKTAQEVVAGINATKQSEERIKELEARLEGLQIEFTKIEKFLFLFDQYNKELANRTAAPVNKMFDYVNFRMFTIQENGALNPCCDILNDEMKPYETAMSSGEKIRAGIDIIKTMSKHYDLFAPVFIDNAESLTHVQEIDSQTIELRASKEHDKLTQI